MVNNIMGEMIKWNCVENCNAECCGMVPIPSQTYKIFKRKIKKPIKDVMKLCGNIVLITEDCSCAFLDNNHKCSIYGHRPEICKLYGTIKELQCPYVDVYGYKRTEDDTIKTKELIKLQDKVRMDMVK